MSNSKIIVLLSGQIASGKSTISNGLRDDFGFKIISSKVVLNELALKKHRGKIPDQRDFWQKFGRTMDEKTNGAWVLQHMQKEINEHDRILIDSVRIQEQINSFRVAYGQAVVHIHAHAEEEWRRKYFIERAKEIDFKSEEEANEKFDTYAKDPTEQGVKEFKNNADLVIHTADSASGRDQVIRAASFLRLLPPLDKRNVDIVIGGQFGSEGKGQIAAYLAPQYDCLVRVGGPNAGHKVYNEPQPDIFRIIPSGSMKAGEAKLVLGPGTVINEEVLLGEITKYGIEPGRLIIDENAILIKKTDMTKEEKIDKIGSTKQGVGAATANNILARLKEETKHKVTNSGKLKAYIGKAHYEFEKLHRDGAKILLEGTQGAMLSIHHGYYPHVTSRDTNVSGCLAEAGMGPHRVRKIIMVTRRYPIRVKNPSEGTSGPFQSAEIDFEEISRRSGYPLDELQRIEKTSVSEKLRRVAEFNWELFRLACELNTPTDIALTFSDYINYENQNARRYDQLSGSTTKFIDEIERCAGVPVSLIATRFSYRSIIDRRNWI